jgi:hypothetical protein
MAVGCDAVLGDNSQKYIAPKDASEDARVYFKKGKESDFETLKK